MSHKSIVMLALNAFLNWVVSPIVNLSFRSTFWMIREMLRRESRCVTTGHAISREKTLCATTIGISGEVSRFGNTNLGVMSHVLLLGLRPRRLLTSVHQGNRRVRSSLWFHTPHDWMKTI